MKTGPLNQVSNKALIAIDRISKVLLKTPNDEWEFVLLQAKEKTKKISFDQAHTRIENMKYKWAKRLANKNRASRKRGVR